MNNEFIQYLTAAQVLSSGEGKSLKPCELADWGSVFSTEPPTYYLTPDNPLRLKFAKSSLSRTARRQRPPSSRPTRCRSTPIATMGLPFSVHVGPDGAASWMRVFDGT